MKTTTFILILSFTGLGLWAQMPPVLHQLPQRFSPATTIPAPPSFPSPAAPLTASSPDINAPGATAGADSNQIIPPGTINFEGVDVDQVLDVYAQLVGRTILRASLPQAQIVLKTETPLTKSEAIEALQAVLALNNIAVINVGDKFVKVVPVDQANSEGAPIDHSSENQLPELGQYVTHIVQLKYVKPSEMVPVIQPFAKLQNSILPIDSNGILVLRDNVENVKLMLEMIDQVDVPVPAEFISEVIPIKYAMVDDIANALNSLGGSSSSIGSATTTPGSTANRPSGTTAGVSGLNGQTGGFNQNQPRALGATGGGATGNTFSQRLQQIIQRAATGGNGEIQILGQTKIIADERSNSLLVYATREDMATIKDIVKKLDVLLSQVLIESVIMDVSLDKGWNFGVSAVQNPQTYSPSQQIVGGGGNNNGQPFLNFLQNVVTNSTSTSTSGRNTTVNNIITSITSSVGGTNSGSSFASSVPSGFSYFANIGPTWDVALQAAASDNSITIIQRPRIQTSQAKEAQFFVGSTVPYVTSVYYNSGIGGGPSSSYEQLQVGITLDVTPFINPDGLVVMDINQEIDDINGSVAISGVGNVPTTDKRTLSSEVAVKDRDTIILGGFIRSEHDKNKSGIPWLEEIPVLGRLFSNSSDSKTRDELIVLMRPTVLRTPELAAEQAVKEEKRLPGIAHAEAEDEVDQRKELQAEEKEDRKNHVFGEKPAPSPETQSDDSTNQTLSNPDNQ
jgi:general secretion pathway protein D